MNPLTAKQSMSVAFIVCILAGVANAGQASLRRRLFNKSNEQKQQDAESQRVNAENNTRATRDNTRRRTRIGELNVELEGERAGLPELQQAVRWAQQEIAENPPTLGNNGDITAHRDEHAWRADTFAEQQRNLRVAENRVRSLEDEIQNLQDIIDRPPRRGPTPAWRVNAAAEMQRALEFRNARARMAAAHNGRRRRLPTTAKQAEEARKQEIIERLIQQGATNIYENPNGRFNFDPKDHQAMIERLIKEGAKDISV